MVERINVQFSPCDSFHSQGGGTGSHPVWAAIKYFLFFSNNEIHKWILIPYYGELALDGVPVRSTTENGEILNEDGF